MTDDRKAALLAVLRKVHRRHAKPSDVLPMLLTLIGAERAEGQIEGHALATRNASVPQAGGVEGQS